MNKLLSCSPWLAAVSAVVACSAPVGSTGPENTGIGGADITSTTKASDYPEAALVSMNIGSMAPYAYCSGSVIGPKVVLTAGHCVSGFDSWDIMAPYNGNQKAHASNGIVFDWVSSGSVDPKLHDVGLILLDSELKISGSQCPVLAQKPVKNNSDIINIGRISGGTAGSTMGNNSMSDLFVGPKNTVTVDGQTGGYYPNSYEGQQDVQEGDSGGPDEVPGSTPHEIVAVNSGIAMYPNMNTGIFARVDLVYSWIQMQAQSHGGLCMASGGGGGGSSGGGDDGGAVNPDGGASSSSSGGGSGGSSGGQNGFGSTGGGGCHVAPGESGSSGLLVLLGFSGIAIAAARRKRS